MSPLESCLESLPVDNPLRLLSKASVEAFREARRLAVDDFRGIKAKSKLQNSDGFFICALENLLGRIEQQAEGMLVSFLNGCFTSSETICRSVVESTINLIYIVQGNTANRLLGYFNVYVLEHSKRLDEWKHWANHDPVTRASVLAAIDGRRQALKIYENVVKQIFDLLKLETAGTNYEWERKLFERFKAIGREDAYWTVYHRMSGATHGNAEETLRSLIGILANQAANKVNIRELMAQETVSYTALMVAIGTRFYIEAVSELCRAYKEERHLDNYEGLLNILGVEVLNLRNDAGCLGTQ